MSTTPNTLFRPTQLALALSLCVGSAHAAPHFTLSNPTPALGDSLVLETEQSQSPERAQLFIGKATGGNVAFDIVDPRRTSVLDPLTLNIVNSGNRLPNSTSIWNNGIAQYSGQIQSGDAYNWQANTSITGLEDGTLTLSEDQFESGIYLLTLKNDASDNQAKTAFVTVAPKTPGSTSKILLLDNDFSALTRSDYVTAQGSKALEGSSPLDFSWPRRTSMDRSARLGPNADAFFFTAWAKNNQVPLEVMSMRAVHANPALLDSYDLVVVTGRSQYWTPELRSALMNRVEAGSLNLALFGGQTMANQVRLEQDNDDTYLVNYNHSWVTPGYPNPAVRVSPDPKAPTYGDYNARGFADEAEKAQAAQIAGSLALAPLSNSSDPSRAAVGTTDQFTGQAFVASLAAPQTINYQINTANADHWAFTGVEGSVTVESKVFSQIDGAEWTLVGDAVSLSANNTETPDNTNVLAYSTDVAANDNHQAAITLLPRGEGYVFNVGNSGWVNALVSEDENGALATITKNVINCLSAAEGNPASPSCSGETPNNGTGETGTGETGTGETGTGETGTGETGTGETGTGTGETGTGTGGGTNPEDTGSTAGGGGGGGGSLGFATLLGLGLLRKRQR